MSVETIRPELRAARVWASNASAEEAGRLLFALLEESRPSTASEFAAADRAAHWLCAQLSLPVGVDAELDALRARIAVLEKLVPVAAAGLPALEAFKGAVAEAMKTPLPPHTSEVVARVEASNAAEASPTPPTALQGAPLPSLSPADSSLLPGRVVLSPPVPVSEQRYEFLLPPEPAQ